MSAQLAFDLPVTDLDKARAQRRAAVSRNIRQGLIAEVPAARETDPLTSHAAIKATTESGKRTTHQRRVLDCVTRLPGLTFHEIAVQVGLNEHATMKRLGDLKGSRPPLVRHGEARVVNGRPCVTWWPCDAR